MVLKDSVGNENKEIKFSDISNTLEIIIAKVHNANISLDKFIQISFDEW